MDPLDKLKRIALGSDGRCWRLRKRVRMQIQLDQCSLDVQPPAGANTAATAFVKDADEGIAGILDQLKDTR